MKIEARAVYMTEKDMLTNKLSIFGWSGFIGSEFVKNLQISRECVLVDRDCIESPTPNAINFISTIHNYNVFDNPFVDIDTNLIKFLEILNAGRRRFGKEFVFTQVSTWFVYGSVHLPAKEDALCNPSGFYSITALAREQLLRSYCETFGLKYRILRLCNILGTNDHKVSAKKNALQWMMSELAAGRDVNIYEGDPIRDYMDVRDAVRAIWLVVEKGEMNQIYNISNGVGRRVGDLVNRANHVLGYPAKVGVQPVPEFHKQIQAQNFYMDNSRLKALGYEPIHDVNKTVEEIALYYAKN